MIIVIVLGRRGRSCGPDRQARRRAGRYRAAAVNRGGGDIDAMIAAGVIGAMIGAAVITTPVICIACVIHGPAIDIAVVPVAGGTTSGVVAAGAAIGGAAGRPAEPGAAKGAVKRPPGEDRRRAGAEQTNTQTDSRHALHCLFPPASGPAIAALRSTFVAPGGG